MKFNYHALREDILLGYAKLGLSEKHDDESFLICGYSLWSIHTF